MNKPKARGNEPFVLRVPGRLWTSNGQRRMHWGTRAGLVKGWRVAVYWSARAAHAPSFSQAEITVQPFQAKGKLADPGAHEPAAKAAIDGLVDAGVLPDDSPVHLVAIRYRAPVRADEDALELTVEPTITVHLPEEASA